MVIGSTKKSLAGEMPLVKARCQELEEEVKKVEQQLHDSQLSLGKAKDDHARWADA